MKTMIYLASQSARRKEILTKLRIPFKVVRSSYQEKMWKHLAPEELVLRHARGKAQKAQVPRGAKWVMGADTIVYCRSEFLGKPKSLKEGRRMLERLSGKMHFVYTGVVLFNPKAQKVLSGVEKTKVYFKRLSKEDILHYHQEVTPLDKAGAYAIQAGPKIVKKIVGSYTNVVGLPQELVKKLMKELVL